MQSGNYDLSARVTPKGSEVSIEIHEKFLIATSFIKWPVQVCSLESVGNMCVRE